MLRLAIISARLAFPLYAANLLLALIPAALITTGFGIGMAQRPWAGALLGSDWINQLGEAAASLSSPLAQPGESRYLSSARWMGLGLLTIPIMAVGQAIAYTFLAGGILERLWAANDPGARGQVRFWAGCRRWFWPFAALGLLNAPAFIIVAVAAGALTSPVERLLGPTASTLLGAIVLSSINGWLELARADMVRQQYRSAPRAFVRAARLLVRPTTGLRAVLAWTLAAILGFTLLAYNAVAIRPVETVAWTTVLASLAAGQLLAFLGAWLKVGRLGVALALDRPATRRLPIAIEDPAPPPAVVRNDPPAAALE